MNMSRDRRSGSTRGHDARDIAPPQKRVVVEVRRSVVKGVGGGVCHLCKKPKRRSVCTTRKADVVMRGRSCISSLSFCQSLIHSICLLYRRFHRYSRYLARLCRRIVKSEYELLEVDLRLRHNCGFCRVAKIQFRTRGTIS